MKLLVVVVVSVGDGKRESEVNHLPFSLLKSELEISLNNTSFALLYTLMATVERPRLLLNSGLVPSFPSDMG